MIQTKNMDTDIDLDVAVKNSVTSTQHDENEEEGQGKTVDLVPWWGRKLAALYIVRIMQGVMSSVTGPTLLDMIEYLGTEMTSLSIVISLGVAGYSVGNILCGLFSSRVQPELHLALNMCVVGCFMAASPWGRSLVYYGVFYMLQFIGIGFFEPCACAYPLHLLRHDKRKNPAEQAVHAAWSVGAFIGPLIAGGFLSPKIAQSGSNITEIYNNLSIQTTVCNEITPDSNCSGFDVNTTKTQMVPFAFITCGALAILSTVPVWVIYVVGPRTENQKEEKKTIWRETSRQPKRFTVLVLVLVCIWYGLYICTELIPAVYIASFVVKYLGWDTFKGPLLTSTMYGAHGLGRIVCVLLSALLSPTKMVVGSMGLTLLAYTILVSLHSVHPAFVWLSMALAGSVMSGFYGSGIVFISGHIHVRNMEASFITFGSAVGLMFANFFTAYMFQTYSPLWVLYIMLGAAVGEVLVFILLWVVLSRYRSKLYHEDVDIESDSNPINK